MGARAEGGGRTGLIAATIIWLVVLLLTVPLLVHPYIVNGLDHLVHFYSFVWTSAFGLFVALLVAAVPLTVSWLRVLRR